MHHDTRKYSDHSLTRTAALLTVAAMTALAGCSDSEPAANAGANNPGTSSTLARTGTTSTTVAVTEPPPTTAPQTAPTTTNTPGTDQLGTATTDTEDLSGQIERVLAGVIAPGAIRWDVSGVDIPPTAAVAAVRIPGSHDVLVAVGENVDGTPAEADAPFPVATLTGSLVRSIAFQLVDEGALDPTLTVDHWVPALPNADRVTVQMVIDHETGWSDYGPIEPDPVVTDFARAWTLREVLELRATTMTALAEPGTRTNAGVNNETMLGLVVEEVGGRPLADLVRERVTEPVGLADTGLLVGDTTPTGYRHGVFAYAGTTPTDTSAFDGTSFVTWNQATHSSVSTPTDLLDLLDIWVNGELFTTDRTPAPTRYAPDPAGNPNTYVGLGVPFNGYCPCTDVDGGIEPTAIGRTPGAIGTKTFLLRYADGISVVFNVNSNEATLIADLEAVANEIHDIAAAAL